MVLKDNYNHKRNNLGSFSVYSKIGRVNVNVRKGDQIYDESSNRTV